MCHHTMSQKRAALQTQLTLPFSLRKVMRLCLFACLCPSSRLCLVAAARAICSAMAFRSTRSRSPQRGGSQCPAGCFPLQVRVRNPTQSLLNMSRFEVYLPTDQMSETFVVVRRLVAAALSLPLGGFEVLEEGLGDTEPLTDTAAIPLSPLSVVLTRRHGSDMSHMTHPEMGRHHIHSLCKHATGRPAKAQRCRIRVRVIR